VAGTAVGKLIELHQLDPAALASYSEPVVVLLKSASGDEEVAAVGPLLKGVVLAQDLPHLSHLGELVMTAITQLMFPLSQGDINCCSTWHGGCGVMSVCCRYQRTLHL
jgi:hypothetical protein